MTMLNQLHEYENNATVREILNAMFCTNNDAELFEAIKNEDNDLVWSWCDSANMERSELVKLIKDSLDNRNCFRVVCEEGPAGGWPEVELDLNNNIKLAIDWVTED